MSMARSEGVLFLELLEELLHALVGEVAAHPLDELEHHPRARIALGKPLPQAGAADDRGIELHARLLQLRGHLRQVLDAQSQVLDAGAEMLDEAGDLRFRGGPLEEI